VKLPDNGYWRAPWSPPDVVLEIAQQASFFGLEIGMLEDDGERRHGVSIDHTLNLMRGASSNIRYRPACLRGNTILRGRKKGKQRREGTRSDDNLSLKIEERAFEQKLADAKGGLQHCRRLQTPDSTTRKVRNGPASVNQNFVINGVDDRGVYVTC
jgi:hypothetical protein